MYQTSVPTYFDTVFVRYSYERMIIYRQFEKIIRILDLANILHRFADLITVVPIEVFLKY